MDDLTKKDIFDFFYSKQQVSRRGGGVIKSKMCRNNVSYENMTTLKKRVELLSDEKIMKYYQKLADRDSKLAPPPSPK